MNEIEWVEFFPNFYEALIPGMQRIFLNWNTPGQYWEFAIGRTIEFTHEDRSEVEEYIKHWYEDYLWVNDLY